MEAKPQLLLSTGPPKVRDLKLQPQRVFPVENSHSKGYLEPGIELGATKTQKLKSSSSVRSLNSSISQAVDNPVQLKFPNTGTLNSLDQNLFFMTSSYSPKKRRVANQILNQNKSHEEPRPSISGTKDSRRLLVKSLSPIIENDEPLIKQTLDKRETFEFPGSSAGKNHTSMPSLVLKSEVPTLKQLPGSKERIRNYDFDMQKHTIVFPGLKVRQYDHRILREPTMQKVVMRDQLLIFNDKSFSLKGILSDELFMNLLREHAILPSLKRINLMLESIMGILDQLSKLMLYDFKDDPALLEIESNPIEEAIKAGLEPQDERANFADNIKLFRKVHQYYRTCLEVFFLMCKFRHHDLVLPDYACQRLVSLCEKGRFLMGSLVQDMKMEAPKAEHQRKLKIVLRRDRRRAIVSNPSEINSVSDQLKKEERTMKELIKDLYKIKFNKKELKTKAEKLDLKHEIMVNQLNFVEGVGGVRRNPKPSKASEVEALAEQRAKWAEEKLGRQELLAQRIVATIEVVEAVKRESSETHRVGLVTRAIRQLNKTANKVHQATSSLHKPKSKSLLNDSQR